MNWCRSLLVSTLVVFAGENVAQVTTPNLEDLIPRKFINKIDLVVGPSLHFPSDHGYSAFMRDGSLGASSYKIMRQAGFTAGLGAVHSTKGRIEFEGQLLLERKGYKEEEVTVGDKIYKYTGDTRIDYATIALGLGRNGGKNMGLHISSGAFYGYFIKGLRREAIYANDVLLQNSITKNSQEIEPYLAGLFMGIGVSCYSNKKIELVAQIKGNYSLNNVMSVNRLTISYNSLQAGAILKIKR